MGMRRSQVNTVSTSAKCRNTLSDILSANAFATGVKKTSEILEELPAGFAGTLDCLLKRCHVTTNKLSELTDLSITTITRYRTDNNIRRKLSVVVLICLALKLNAIFSFDLIRKAGFSFNCSIEHIAYQTLLLASGTLTIEQCNEYLTSIGLKPLNK